MHIPLKHYGRFLGTYLAPLKLTVLILAMLILANIGLQLVNPQILRYFIDAAQSAAPFAALVGAALVFIGVALAQQVVSVFATYFSEKVSWTASNTLRNHLMAHCIGLDMSFHNAHTPGEMIERIDGDVSAMGSFFSQFIIQIVGNALLLMGILILLYWENWRIGLALNVYAVIAFILLNLLKDLATPHWKALRETSADFFGFLEERLAGGEDIRSCNAIPFVLRRFYELTRLWLKRQIKAALVTNVMVNSSWVLFALGNALALGLSAHLYTRNWITVGTVYLIFHYANMLNQPIQRITSEIETFQRAGASIARIKELTARQSRIQDGHRSSAPSRALGVQFQNVSFAYGQDDVLRDVSFLLEQGKTLGLLGRTGSGKTTVIRLLFRLYDPTQGVVRLDDTNIRDFAVKTLRGRIGMVTQSVQLFQTTVRDNLTLFSDAISDEQILDVMEQLGLSEWLATLERGLDTKLGVQGTGLSAGEEQLLAFARVFLRKDPGLLILDEASSRLDPATERRIEAAIARLLQDRTAIVIAHRLSTVERADEIMILEDGIVREYGAKRVLQLDPASRFHRLLQTGLDEALA